MSPFEWNSDVMTVSKPSKGGKENQKLIKKRMENSLPWSISRWFARLLMKKK